MGTDVGIRRSPSQSFFPPGEGLPVCEALAFRLAAYPCRGARSYLAGSNPALTLQTENYETLDNDVHPDGCTVTVIVGSTSGVVIVTGTVVDTPDEVGDASISYTSTSATPVVPPTPLTWAL